MFVVENKNIKKILSEYETIWSLGHANALMSWDLEINMPQNASSERGLASSKISSLIQKHYLSSRLKTLINLAENEPLNDLERGILRVISNNIKKFEKLPFEFVEKFSKLTNESQVAWRNARKNKNFKEFKPYLEQIVNLSIERADYLKTNESNSYEVLFREFEEDATLSDVDRVFSEIEPFLKSKIKYVLESDNYSNVNSLANEKYTLQRAKRLNEILLDKMGFDNLRQRMDISTHPFSDRMSKNDIRLTTRYKENDFKETLLATLHEYGHSVYEREISPNLNFTPVDAGVSLGIHESQSRFWENHIGRSREFAYTNYDLIKFYLPFLSKYKKEDLYRYLNYVNPSFIRVEADELTYNLHVILRYNIEKKLINEKLDVSEVPSVWNDTMNEYFGITPKDDSQGCLQDVHWSMGAIGYFPTYTLGTVFASQVVSHLNNEIGHIDNYIKSNDYGTITDYLRTKILRYGSIYEPKKLIRKAFSEDLDSRYYIKYMDDKYSDLY